MPGPNVFYRHRINGLIYRMVKLIRLTLVSPDNSRGHSVPETIARRSSSMPKQSKQGGDKSKNL